VKFSPCFRVHTVHDAGRGCVRRQGWVSGADEADRRKSKLNLSRSINTGRQQLFHRQRSVQVANQRPHYGAWPCEEYIGNHLIFYSKERRLEYDWVVAPGADPKQIRVKWED